MDLMLNIHLFLNLDFTVKYDLTWFSRDSLKHSLVFSSQRNVWYGAYALASGGQTTCLFRRRFDRPCEGDGVWVRGGGIL